VVVVATFGVLGPLRVIDDGVEIVLTGQRQRRLLCALLLHRGRVVSVDRLSELVWDADTPLDSAALQSLVFRLRQRIPGLDLDYRAPGYVLGVADDSVDAARFEHLVLGAIERRGADPERSLELIDEALRLWRGDPFADLVDNDDARVEIDRVLEVRCRALEERFELQLDLGRAADAIADVEAFAAREPLRERPRHLLMRAYESLGRRGEALRVYDAYRRLLADELGVAPSPELRRRHEDLLARDEVTLAPDARAVPLHTRSPLRAPTSSFIGREDLVVETIGRFGSSRLITLIGPGGVGKTRLATEVARRLDGAGLDGAGLDSVALCDLTTATNRTVIDVAMAAAGVESRSDQPDLDRLVEVMRHERCCVVLDNCEHVIDEAATVAERLVEMTDHVVVLATSRERLAVDGERLIAVPPLTLAGGPASPATRLLVERMAAVTGRSPDPQELAQLDVLAGRLDGLPLALELAAARLQTLTPQEVLDGVEESIAVLRGGRRTVERHRSVEAALRWSYDLLDDSARTALRAAATFTAPFDAADVAAIMAVDRSRAVDALSILIERSMAHREGDGVSLLHVVRGFAREQTGPDELDRWSRRLALRMCDVATDLRADLRSAVDSTPIDRYIARVPDFRRAVEISLAADDADTALRTVSSLRDLAFTSSSFELARWAEDAATLGQRADHELTVDGYSIAGLGAWKRGSLDDTRRLVSLAEHVTAARDLQPTYELLGVQATEDLAHGALDRAIERLEQATALPDTADDPIRRGETYGTLAICMAYAHRSGAVELADAITADMATEPAAVARAWCQYASGECRMDTDPAAARRHLDRAVELARTGGSTFIEGIAGASLASLDVRANDVAAAVENYRWLLPLWLRAGLQSPFWTGMRAVVELLKRSGESIAAIRLLGAVLAPGAGHDVYGDDADRLDSVRAELEEQAGRERFHEEFAIGSGFDEAAAAREATTAFDRLTRSAP
jgi:predicted ATPase/DNA-binding SARP family transcriptional activator